MRMVAPGFNPGANDKRIFSPIGTAHMVRGFEQLWAATTPILPALRPFAEM